MNLRLEGTSIILTNLSHFKHISIENDKRNPKITVKYKENFPPFANQPLESCTITYEKLMTGTHIVYNKKLSEKSGFDMDIIVNEYQNVLSGHIDFYTIKQSSNKRSSFYRLEFRNNLFILYVVGRKDGYKKQIASCILDNKITSSDLANVMLSMMKNIINYAEKHNKQKLVLADCQTVYSLIEIEKQIIQELNEEILYGYSSDEEKAALKSFLLRYNRLEEKPQTLVKAKK